MYHVSASVRLFTVAAVAASLTCRAWSQDSIGFQNEMSSTIDVLLRENAWTPPAATLRLRPGQPGEIRLPPVAVFEIEVVPLDRPDTGGQFGRHDLRLLARLMNRQDVSFKGERVIRLVGRERGRRGRVRNVYARVRVAMYMDTYRLIDGRQIRYTTPVIGY